MQRPNFSMRTQEARFALKPQSIPMPLSANPMIVNVILTRPFSACIRGHSRLKNSDKEYSRLSKMRFADVPPCDIVTEQTISSISVYPLQSENRTICVG